MLTHLHIRHFAIIDDSELELGEGMTALTGETGAGKSILLGALGQVLGERASGSDVQQGQARAEISASFRLDALPGVHRWLAEHELDVEDGEDCVLRRTLSAAGKSRSTVNGTPVSLKMLGELGERLVGIHGQHAHQTLGRTSEQRRVLDAWSEAQEAVPGLATGRTTGRPGTTTSADANAGTDMGAKTKVASRKGVSKEGVAKEGASRKGASKKRVTGKSAAKKASASTGKPGKPGKAVITSTRTSIPGTVTLANARAPIAADAPTTPGGGQGPSGTGLSGAVRGAHAAWSEVDARLRRALDDSRGREQRIDLLRFQLQEFDELDIGALALADIEAEHRWLANVERLRHLGNDALDALEGDADAALNRALKPLRELASIDERLQESLDLVESASIQAAEAASTLRGEVSALEHDDARLDWLDEKLGVLHALAKKHRVDPAELAAVEERLRDELDSLTGPGSSADALEAERDARLADYLAAAKALGARRVRDAKRLGALVTDAMQTLAMEGGQFVVNVETDPAVRSPHGMETITFLVSPNPGIVPAPLGRIASGGELSRIGLALQLATSDSRSVPTLIFDEVDAGIGGAVAETVGQLLRRVGERAQVLCVTHLPQVAAQAHHHLRVTKSVADGMTRTGVEPLAGTATRDEIARMLGGAKLTTRSRQHAQEMLDAAR